MRHKFSQKQTNLFCLLFYSSRQTNQIRLFVFLGESTARQSAFRFYLTFRMSGMGIKGHFFTNYKSNILTKELEIR